MDTFDIDCDFVGPVDRVQIEHDNTGAGPAWFLDKIVIDDLPRKKKYEFPCGRWLDKDKDDGSISRDLSLGGSFDLDFDGIDVKGPKVKKPKKKFSFGSKDKEKKVKTPKKKDEDDEESYRKRHGFSLNLPSFSLKRGDKKHDTSIEGDVKVPDVERKGMSSRMDIGMGFSVFNADSTVLMYHAIWAKHKKSQPLTRLSLPKAKYAKCYPAV